jgi:hypothetical protein
MQQKNRVKVETYSYRSHTVTVESKVKMFCFIGFKPFLIVFLIIQLINKFNTLEIPEKKV